MSDADVNAPEKIVASSDDDDDMTWTDLTNESPDQGEFEVLITEEVTEEPTVVVAAGPLSTSWRVLSNDRLPAYLTAAGLVVMGIIDPPVAIGAAIIYEGVRRLNNSYREVSR